MKKKTKRIVKIVTLCMVVFVVAAGGSFAGNLIASNMLVVSDQQKPEVEKVSSNKIVSDQSDVAKNASKSVVEIRTESVMRDNYFGNYTSEGAGSGVIASEDGYIITNYHVIEGAKKITVTLPNGKQYEARFVNGSEQDDIALLKIDAEDLDAVRFGDSDNLLVGEKVLAIGNPLGELGGSVTQGIISSTSRDIQVEGKMMQLLQTDAAINPGNSGGGLFNMNGELIGIVTAKKGGTNVEGLGFAIPSTHVRDLVDKMIDADK